MSTTKTLIILAHALVGWALCGAVMLMGRTGLIPMRNRPTTARRAMHG